MKPNFSQDNVMTFEDFADQYCSSMIDEYIQDCAWTRNFNAFKLGEAIITEAHREGIILTEVEDSEELLWNWYESTEKNLS